MPSAMADMLHLVHPLESRRHVGVAVRRHVECEREIESAPAEELDEDKVRARGRWPAMNHDKL